MKERWIEYTKKADFDLWAKELGISPLSARILRNRDIETLEDAGKFLYGTMDELADPYLMKDMEEGVSVLSEAVLRKQTVAIASDFDDDGIFAGEILYEGIRRVGGAAMLFTPDRVREGYGLNRRIIDEASEKGCSVILTCDNGIVANEEVSYAKSLGMKVVVTDHHEPGDELPPADAVIDPHRKDCDYPFKGLCGAGVSFRLIQALYERFHIPKEEEQAFYEYLAIATVADVVELLGENRIIAKTGIEAIRHTRKLGLSALIRECGISKEKITSYHLGFVIGPSFNAVGRLSNVRLAFDLLQTVDVMEAERLSKEIRDLNEQRKEMTDEGLQMAFDLVESAPWKEDRILLVPLKGVHESVIGIIAGKIKERYHKPVFVLTEGEGGLKASGRSIEAYHMQRGLMACADLLEKFGGHAMAAGLTVKKENLEVLRKRLNDECGLTEEDLQPIVHVDARMPLSYISESLIEELESLGPYGSAFTKPVFAKPHFKMHRLSYLGKAKNNVKMILSDGSGVRMEALLFREADLFITFLRENFGDVAVERALNGLENPIDVAFTFYPDINEYQGRKSLQIVCQSYCVIPQKTV